MGNEAKLMISLGTGLFAGWLAKELTKNYGAKKSRNIGRFVAGLTMAAMYKKVYAQQGGRTSSGNDLSEEFSNKIEFDQFSLHKSDEKSLTQSKAEMTTSNAKNIIRKWIYEAFSFIKANADRANSDENELVYVLETMLNNGKIQIDDVSKRYESMQHPMHSSDTLAFFDAFPDTVTGKPRNIIVIDINKTLSIKNGFHELIDTLAHEGWHAVQNRRGEIVVNEDKILMYDPRKIREEDVEGKAYEMGAKFYNLFSRKNNLPLRSLN